MATTTNSTQDCADIGEVEIIAIDKISNVNQTLGDSKENPIFIVEEEPNSVTKTAGTTNSQIQHDFHLNEAERLAKFEDLFHVDREEYWKQVYEEVEFLKLKEMVKEVANEMNNSNV